MPAIPNQTRTLDSFSDHRWSNTINRFTRLITGGRDVILPYDVNRSVFNLTPMIPNAYTQEPHPYDVNRNFIIDDDELVQANVDRINGEITQDQYDRIAELAPGYHFDVDSPDGFAPNTILEDSPYELDYDEDWRIDDDELVLITNKWYDYLYNRYGNPTPEDDVTSYEQVVFAQKANESGGYHYDGTSSPDGYKPIPYGVTTGPLPWDSNGDWKITYDDIIAASDAIFRGDTTSIDTGHVQRLFEYFTAGGYHPRQDGEALDFYFTNYSIGSLPAQQLKIGPGYLIRHDTLIHVKEDAIIDLSDNNNYIGVSPSDFAMNRTGVIDGTSSATKMYFILARYVYSRSKPEPELAYVIAQNRQAYLQNMSDYIYLGSFEVGIGNGSSLLGITRIFDHDTNENEGNVRIERPMYIHHVSVVDGGVIDEYGQMTQTGTDPVSEAILFE